MSREIFEHDANTGMTHYWDEDPTTGDVQFTSEEDVEPLVERNKLWANEGATDQGIKNGLFHYADIPMSLVHELKKKGIDLMHPSPADWQAFFKIVETDYPMLKTTHKKMWRPR